MNKDEHRAMLSQFEVDRLIKLLAIEAKKNHDGHFTILSFTTHYKVAFGTPRCAYEGNFEISGVQGFEKLKDALIDALVQGKRFSDYEAAGAEIEDSAMREIHDELTRQAAEAFK